MIPFIDLQAQQERIADKLRARIAAVLEHGAYIMGPEVGELEERLADSCGAKHCVTCSNGTDALLLPLRAKGIGPGDAVFVPSFTFVATAEVVSALGATPLFVDVLPDTFNMGAQSLEAAIAFARTRGLTPRAVIPVDLFGQPADYDAIAAVAQQNGLWVLADSAQGFGATYKGRRTGTLGLATATSFFPAKPLGCYGDGGAIFTDDDALAAVLRSLRVHGKGADKYDNVRIGMNARLDTLQAAILLEKLAIFEDEIERRNAVAARYSAALAGTVHVPAVMDNAVSTWAQYTIRVPAQRRDAMAAHLKAQGVPTAVYYPTPLHRQTAYRDAPVMPGGLPVSEALAQEVLSLPMGPYLKSRETKIIFNAIHSFNK